MKTRIYTTLIILSALLISFGTQAKGLGKFSKYTQVTDKEVLLESTNGSKILFSAFDNHSIGISYINKDSKVRLISPAVIFEHVELNGSIYVEELDDMMQITTTSNDGLIIKINKKEFGFTFIDKTNKQEMKVEDNLLTQVVSNENTLLVSIDSLGQLCYKQNLNL